MEIVEKILNNNRDEAKAANMLKPYKQEERLSNILLNWKQQGI